VCVIEGMFCAFAGIIASRFSLNPGGNVVGGQADREIGGVPAEEATATFE
jgi:hypothetical protein